MWDQGSKGWDQGSEGWDLESLCPGIRDHEPRNQDQQLLFLFITLFLFFFFFSFFFLSRNQGSGCTMFVRSWYNICHSFGIKVQLFGPQTKLRDQRWKICFVRTLIHAFRSTVLWVTKKWGYFSHDNCHRLVVGRKTWNLLMFVWNFVLRSAVNIWHTYFVLIYMIIMPSCCFEY